MQRLMRPPPQITNHRDDRMRRRRIDDRARDNLYPHPQEIQASRQPPFRFHPQQKRKR